MRRNGIAENAGLGLTAGQIAQIDALNPTAQAKMIRRYDTVVNVLDCGALADLNTLSTDNADAFQAAIDAAETSGYPVVVPSGRYFAHLQTRSSWVVSTAYLVNDVVTHGGRVYRCTQAGTSSNPGPSGTGSSITDGTAIWTHKRRGTGALTCTADATISIIGDSRSVPFIRVGPTTQTGELLTFRHVLGANLTIENITFEGPTNAPATAQFCSNLYSLGSGTVTLRNVTSTKFRNNFWTADGGVGKRMVFEAHGGRIEAYGESTYFHDCVTAGDGEARFFGVAQKQANDTALNLGSNLHCVYLTQPCSLYVDAACRFEGATDALITHNSGSIAPKYTVIEGGYFANAPTGILGNSVGVTQIGSPVFENVGIGIRTAAGGTIMTAPRFKGGGIGGTVTAFADYGATVAGKVLVTTSASHGMITGDTVRISGTTNYNGNFLITKISATTFYITDTWVSNDATGVWGRAATYGIYEHAAGNVQIDSIRASGAFVTAAVYRILATSTRWTINAGDISPSEGNGVYQDACAGDPEWVIGSGLAVTNIHARAGHWRIGAATISNQLEPASMPRAMSMHFDGTTFVGDSILNVSAAPGFALTLTGMPRYRDTAKPYMVASANLKGQLQLCPGVNPSDTASAPTVYLDPKYTTHRITGTTQIDNLNLQDSTRVAIHGYACRAMLIAVGALPIGTGGNIVPIGGIGRTLAAGETLVLDYDNRSAKWREPGKW